MKIETDRPHRMKFRCWDKKSKTMATDLDFNRVIANFHGLNDKEWADLIWMQSTGLSDKDGREIYEGDIISDREKITIVEWDNEEGRWGNSAYCFRLLFSVWKVIGNIYAGKNCVGCGKKIKINKKYPLADRCARCAERMSI